jgi:hypothetical protein
VLPGRAIGRVQMATLLTISHGLLSLRTRLTALCTALALVGCAAPAQRTELQLQIDQRDFASALVEFCGGALDLANVPVVLLFAAGQFLEITRGCVITPAICAPDALSETPREEIRG